jgi:hypothetical protein
MTRPGDLLLVAGGSDWESRVIRVGTHSHWTHVAIFMDAGRLLAEATHQGIAFADVAKYDKQVRWIDTGLTDDLAGSGVPVRQFVYRATLRKNADRRHCAGVAFRAATLSRHGKH